MEDGMGLVFWRAIRETRACFDWAHKWVWICVALATWPVAWGYLWAFGQSKAVYGEMNTAAATLAAIATIALIIFVINLCRSPILIIREKDQAIATLKNEKAELQEAMRPKLSIAHRAHADPWLQVGQSQNPNSEIYDSGFIYTYRVSISNTGMEVVRNLRVTIAEIVPPELRGTPHHLHFTNDNLAPHMEVRDLPMTLSETNGQFVDVVVCWLGNGDRQQMSFSHITNGVSGVVPAQPYEFSIFVSSDNGGATIQQRCRFTFRDNASPLLEFI